MAELILKESIQLPESVFDIVEHLGLSKANRAQNAWFELSGAVLSHYVVDRKQRLAKLLNWFYQDLGFCAKDPYFSAEAADLGQCLQSRQGNSTTLATVLILLGKQLDLSLSPILLPGYTVVCAQIDDEFKYIDPLNGKTLTKHQLHVLVRGELGNEAKLKASYLKAATLKRLISRMLHELKAGCILSQKFEAAMECCNLLLQWHPTDVNLHRERAFITQQLGCISIAAADLAHFIDNSPHDPLIELVKLQLNELKKEVEVFH